MGGTPITLLWQPWTLVFSIIFVVATAAVCLFSWSRAGYSRWFGLLELLRFAIVMGAAVLLNQPEWVQQFRPDAKPSVAVIYDDSPSMGTRDSQNPAGDVVTRQEAIEQLTQQETWKSLQDKMDVLVQPFSGVDVNEGSESGSSSTSNLGKPMLAVAEKAANLRAMVVISDGDWNDGDPPVQAAKQLRMDGVPVFTMPVGSATRLPDVELLSVDAPTFGVAGKSVRCLLYTSPSPRD